MSFAIFAYYERQSCKSGVTVPKFGFRANISNNKFNIDKIKQALEKEITLNSQDIDTELIDSLNHLNRLNISVREFSKYRNLFNQTQHPEILSKIFDDTKINKTYGCIAIDQPGLWQVTADTGINSLEFFKTIINLASNPEIANDKDKLENGEQESVKLTNREKYDLELRASDILFKKELDMETIAPKVTWK
jgi:hypothetical protein